MNSRFWFGITLIAAGALFLLDTLRVIDVGSVVWTFWPLLLVVWGLFIILRKREGVSAAPSPDWDQAFGDIDTVLTADTLKHSAVFGDLTVRVTSKSFRGGTLSTVFGDTVLDLREAVLADGEQTLSLNGVFGDCSIRLPAGTPYALVANSVFGSLRTPDQKREGFGPNLSFDSPGYAGAAKRLSVRASQVFGDIRLEA